MIRDWLSLENNQCTRTVRNSRSRPNQYRYAALYHVLCQYNVLRRSTAIAREGDLYTLRPPTRQMTFLALVFSSSLTFTSFIMLDCTFFAPSPYSHNNRQSVYIRRRSWRHSSQYTVAYYDRVSARCAEGLSIEQLSISLLHTCSYSHARTHCPRAYCSLNDSPPASARWSDVSNLSGHPLSMTTAMPNVHFHRQ